jgi:NFU1 iron-sulfur cluster scaffold homolog, mitochondrial
MNKKRKTPETGESALRRFIEEDLGGVISADGGTLEWIGLSGNTVSVRLTGACAACPCRHKTVRQFIEPRVKERFGKKFTVDAQITKPYYMK